MTNYDLLARFYDYFHGDGAARAGIYRSLITRYHPSATTVLELGCGTGSVLNQLQKDYAVTGLDLSPGMLEVARRKVPGVVLIEGDMTRFRLDERFDVIISAYDSLNHLLEFRQWEKVFARAYEHLNAGGLFVFDINTEHNLDLFEKRPTWVQWIGEEHLLIVEPRQDGLLHYADASVFENLGGGRYELHKESVPEVSFPRTQIEEGLKARFRRVSVHDQKRKRPTALSERLHFVASK